MASNALATVEHGTLPTARDWETMLSMSEVLVRSGMLPEHIKTPQAAVAIIQKGRELGIQPMYALSNIVSIQGKPTANAELMLALIYRDHGDDAIRFAETTGKRCVIAYKRRGWKESLSHAFTIEDANTAGLTNGRNGATWTKYGPAMLRARCISAVARMAFPDSIGGMYTPEEMGAEVDGDGEVIHPAAEPTGGPLGSMREVRPPSTPIVPERAAPLSAPRLKASVQPNGADETRRKLVELGNARGVPLTAEMDAEAMADLIDACLDALGIPVAVAHPVTARALHNALVALPPRAVDEETGEVSEGDDDFSEVDRLVDAGLAAQAAARGTEE
jgi:hypothetical protein